MRKLHIYTIIALLLLPITLAVDSCGTYNTSTTLSNDLNTSATCITLNTNDTIFDCNNHIINYSQSAAGIGITITARKNIVIQNCILLTRYMPPYGVQAITSTATLTNLTIINNTIYHTPGSNTNPYVVYLSGPTDATISNNLIQLKHNSTITGVFFVNNVNSIINNNTINTTNTGNARDSYTISGAINNYLYVENNTMTGNTTISTARLYFISNTGTNIQVKNNFVTLNGQTTANAITSANLNNAQIINNTFYTTRETIVITGNNNTIENNTLTLNGGSASGTLQTTLHNSTINNNQISCYGPTAPNWCFRLTGGTNNIFTNNYMYNNATIVSGNTISYYINSATNYYFQNNKIKNTNSRSTLAAQAFGIQLINSTNITFINQSQYHDSTTNTRYLVTSNTSTATFTNYTLYDNNIEIAFSTPQIGSINNNITYTDFTFTTNSTLVNTTLQPLLNITTIITLPLTGTENAPSVDINLNNTYQVCSYCTNWQIQNSKITFTVPYWLRYATTTNGTTTTCTYSGTGNWALSCTDNCILNTNTSINGNITMTGTGTINLNAFWKFLTPHNRIYINTGCKLYINTGGGFR